MPWEFALDNVVLHGAEPLQDWSQPIVPAGPAEHGFREPASSGVYKTNAGLLVHGNALLYFMPRPPLPCPALPCPCPALPCDLPKVLTLLQWGKLESSLLPFRGCCTKDRQA